MGGRGTALDAAQRAPGDVLRYLELHIEQAVSLDRAGLPLGVVTAIAAPSRYRVAVRGRQDHAGGTPMADRRDAVAAAAELVLLVERLARDAGRGMVGTVGVIEARPNMINIVPGEADLRVDFRGIDPAAIAETLGALRDRNRGARRAARRRGRMDLPHAGRAAHRLARDGRRHRGRGPRPRRSASRSRAAPATTRTTWRASARSASSSFRAARAAATAPRSGPRSTHLATGARVLLEVLLRLDRDLA